MPEDKVASILEHITEGCGVLQTARLVKVHPDTVSRYTRAAGAQARAAHDELVARSPTAFVERHNETDRNRNARRARKTYCFSKGWWTHRAATFFSNYSYNFCWPVRTLKVKGGEAQTPAMMAKLADHVWTLAEWIKRPTVPLV